MENTTENKEKFFAQYWGQLVLYIGGIGLVRLGTGGWNLKHPDFFLELTPLSMISDEDMAELSETDVQSIDEYGFNLFYGGSKSFVSSDIDYLRSKGYALPFNGTSIENLISYGWIKLKTI